MDTAKIGLRVLELRTTILKKKQIEFAQDLETTQGNISQIEGGMCVPTGNFFIKIDERYPECNFNWLITGEGYPEKSAEVLRIEAIAWKKKESKAVKNLEKEVERLKENETRLIRMADASLSKKR